MVYVISMNDEPLMPTENHAKVRVLLKHGKAKVIYRCPFTVKLLYETEHHTQPVTAGVDTGSGNAGNAAVTGKGKIIYISDVTLRNDIKDTMDDRRKYRRIRRNRKTRYREPRFDNRGSSRRPDRLPPTLVSKIACHDRELAFMHRILPVTRTVLETATFDPHLLKNPMLADPGIRHWGYQKGTNYGFANTKAYVLHRDNYTCQCCKGKRKDSKLEAHHKVFRSDGGSDDPENLITMCHTCHRLYHAGKLKNFHPEGIKKSWLLHATQMNVIRSQLMKGHPEAIETFGYITKKNRQSLGLEKDHWVDACVIASGGTPVYLGKGVQLLRKRCTNRHDYRKTRGIRSEEPINTHKIMGFKKFDRVRYFGHEYFIKGRMSTGYAILMDIHGAKTDFSKMPKGYKTPKLVNCRRTGARTSWMVTAVEATLNTA